MPHWGITGLSRRDVDAVARYILGELRDPDADRNRTVRRESTGLGS